MSLVELTVPKFQTTDGTIFEDRNAAVAHQASLEAAESIAAYVATATENEKYRTRLKSTLDEFIRWKALNAA